MSLPLCGFGLPTDLLLDLPVGEQILVAATRTLPGTLDRVGAALMKHFHDEVTMETHGRVTENHFSLCRFGYNCHIKPPVRVRGSIPQTAAHRFANYSTYNCFYERVGLGASLERFVEEPVRYYRRNF